jgi:DNA-binding XRE family transcriptional regulator
MSDDVTKRPPWRPSLYQPEFCERVVEAGRMGKSIAWMAANIGVSKETLYAWEREKPDFSDALKLARTLSQSWWEDLGQDHAINEPNGPTINASLYSRSMAARFPDDWRENTKTDVNHTGKVETVNRIELVAMGQDGNGKS